MANVIGRADEKLILQNALSSNRAELIVVYGRRRIGKTYLISEVYKKHICFEFSGIHKASYKDQLKKFEERLAHISAKNPDKEVKIQVEKFQNRFLIQRNEIDYFRHDIKQQENELELEEQTAPIVSVERTLEEEEALKERREIFVSLFEEMKKEFNVFVEEHL